MLQINEQEVKPPIVYPKGPITPRECLEALQVNVAGATQCVVTNTRTDGPLSNHLWCPVGSDFASWVVKVSNGHPSMYFTLGSFDPVNTRQYSKKKEGGDDTGRTFENSLWLRGFCLDIDGGPFKWADALAKGKSTEGLYETAKECLNAAKAFIKASKIIPTFLVESGSGGLHLHYLLTEPIRRDEWHGRAVRLVEVAKEHGLKIDAPCTTDAARIFRAPGSIHQKSGKVVQAHSLGIAPYTLEQWDKKIEFDPAKVAQLPAPRARIARADSVNAAVLANQHQPYSYKLAAQFCGAMRKATEANGRGTLEPVWILALQAAALSIEGVAYAHEISSGHDDYDESKTDKKLAEREGGPASCAAWRAAYGTGGPCDTCEYGEF